jgi:preprotein translocase subunit SecA
VTGAADDAQRREAYQADVCYVTAVQLMADDLRNRFAPEPIGFRPPELACALVDDIDGVLIDDGETTAQQFFHRYRRLGGVSATLAEARNELASLYGLGVTEIASIYPCFRRHLGVAVIGSTAAWRRAIAARVKQLVASRRPVLVATASDDTAQALLAALHEAGIDATLDGLRAGDSGDAQWMNANDAAGRTGAVTVSAALSRHRVAITLDPLARAAGGLAVIAACLGETRRADRRLGHLTGRQAQPGSVEAIIEFSGSRVLRSLPAPMMRSWVLARRYLGERRAARQRTRHARQSSRRRTGATLARTHRTHLQHEGR